MGENDSRRARAFVQAVCRSVQPCDAIERMIVMQLCWAHGQMALNYDLLVRAKTMQAMEAAQGLVNQTAKLFARALESLGRYRRPAECVEQVKVYTPQANLGSEVRNVQNVFPTNELVPTVLDQGAQALVEIDRTANSTRQGPRQRQRPKARVARGNTPGAATADSTMDQGDDGPRADAGG
jgi:hypothetical protein